MSLSEGHLEPGQRIVRFYTLARRFPQLIGRWPHGGSIPFGPYTLTQFVTGIAVLIAGYCTMPWWGADRGLFLNAVTLAGVCTGLVIAMRKISWRGRAPLPLLRGALTSYRSHGTYRGRSLPQRPLVTFTAAVLIAGEHSLAAAHERLHDLLDGDLAPTGAALSNRTKERSSQRPSSRGPRNQRRQRSWDHRHHVFNAPQPKPQRHKTLTSTTLTAAVQPTPTFPTPAPTTATAPSGLQRLRAATTPNPSTPNPSTAQPRPHSLNQANRQPRRRIAS